jgi:hypothetical protein
MIREKNVTFPFRKNRGANFNSLSSRASKNKPQTMGLVCQNKPGVKYFHNLTQEKLRKVSKSLGSI